MHDDWIELLAGFDRLVAVPPAEQREMLARYPVDLRKQLASLLEADGASGVLDRPAHDGSSDTPSPNLLEPGAMIGNFTVDRLIGRGGSGEVYVASRSGGGFEQRVALKMLRGGLVEGAGFERERRLLAGLEHPGIARLIDGGVTAAGRPWMAMEYIVGEPVDAWCRSRRASLAERLRLFLEICDAVGDAHAALIVHCDLKPANILVDANGRVRLLDFGVARLLDGSSGGGGAATPDYAAPEQFADAPLTVATDVYALGAVLFELLAGTSPWRTGGTAPSLIKRILRDEPPLASEAGAADPPLPAARLAGDLDAIAAKTLRHDPAARYRSVANLADDVRRYRAQRPVAARRGGLGYVAGRFVRRSPWGVAAAVAAVLAVGAGVTGIVVQSQRTAVERDVALAELRRSDSINRMVTLMFREAKDRGGETTTVKQTLDDTAARLVTSVDRSPASATLIMAIADLYFELEDPLGGATLLTRALAAGIGRDDPVATAQMQMNLGNAKATMNDLDGARTLYSAAERVFGSDPRFRGQRLQLIAGRSLIARNSGDRDTAIKLLADSMPEVEMVYAGDHREILTRYNNLLVYLAEANRLDEMPAMFAHAEAALKRTGETGSVFGLATLQLKGAYLYKREDLKGADAIFTRVVELRRARFGRSAGLAADLMQLARTKLALDQPAAALPLLVEAQPLAVATLGAGAVPTLVIGLSLAEARAGTGDAVAAEQALAAVAPAFATPALPPPLKGMFLRVEATVRAAEHRPAEARAALDKAEAIFVAAGPAGALPLKGIARTRMRLGL